MTAHEPAPPRLPLVEEPDDPLARALFEKLAAGRGILNLHRMMAHAPAAMKASGDMAIMFRQDAKLERDVGELAVLRTAQLLDCEYVWLRHLPLAKAAGVTQRQIDEVDRSAASSAFTPTQKAALAFAERVALGSAVDDATFKSVQEAFLPREIVELTMLIGHYVSTAIFIKTLRIPDEKA
jgi:alkylhydroperoxidase family enzyme